MYLQLASLPAVLKYSFGFIFYFLFFIFKNFIGFCFYNNIGKTFHFNQRNLLNTFSKASVLVEFAFDANSTSTDAFESVKISVNILYNTGSKYTIIPYIKIYTVYTVLVQYHGILLLYFCVSGLQQSGRRRESRATVRVRVVPGTIIGFYFN